jgi:hypothetical protein
MAAPAVLVPLFAAGVTATVRADGRLAVRPAERITVALDAYIRAHRVELIAELSVAPAATLSDVLHHPPCPGCGSTAASMLRAGDPNERCARCRPLSSARTRTHNPSGEAP